MAKEKKGGNPKKEEKNQGADTKTKEKPPQGDNAVEDLVSADALRFGGLNHRTRAAFAVRQVVPTQPADAAQQGQGDLRSCLPFVNANFWDAPVGNRQARFVPQDCDERTLGLFEGGLLRPAGGRLLDAQGPLDDLPMAVVERFLGVDSRREYGLKPVVERAVAVQEQSQGTIFREAKEILSIVHETGQLESLSETQLNSLAGAMDQQLVLCY